MMIKRRINSAVFIACGALSTVPAIAADEHAKWEVVEKYCFECHNSDDWAGKVAFDLMSADEVGTQPQIFEAAIRKLRGGLMPPPGAERPDGQTVNELAAWFETTLDSAAAEPLPARVPLRRLNRREYAYGIRDLLGMNIEVEKLLPADDLKGVYDNNADALQVSP